MKYAVTSSPGSAGTMLTTSNCLPGRSGMTSPMCQLFVDVWNGPRSFPSASIRRKRGMAGGACVSHRVPFKQAREGGPLWFAFCAALGLARLLLVGDGCCCCCAPGWFHATERYGALPLTVMARHASLVRWRLEWGGMRPHRRGLRRSART